VLTTYKLNTQQVHMTITQTVLPFKLEMTNDTLTSHAGLALFGEYFGVMGISALVDQNLPRPGSAKGYRPSAFVEPLALMLHGGGRTLEDLRVLREDTGLLRLLGKASLPSSDAVGDWLRRIGNCGMNGLHKVNRCALRRSLNRDTCSGYTLDIDATRLVAEKHAAFYTYKGEKGYMPIVGHLAENGLIVGHEFREGNVAPAARNLEFMQACEANLPKGKTIEAVRADSAAYQAAIFNWCEATGKTFAIGADHDAAVKAAIKAIPENAWTKYNDGEIAETVHCMNKSKDAFRLIIIRRPQQQDLFTPAEPYRYHAIASNRKDEDAMTTLQWYCKRGDASENRIKDLKIGFSMEYMPCGTFAANAAFFAIGTLAYNLYIGFRALALDATMARSQVQTVRWQLYQVAGKIVCHGRQLILKVNQNAMTAFAAIRERCVTLLQEGDQIPQTP
jgi:Transposase DDE domain group 1